MKKTHAGRPLIGIGACLAGNAVRSNREEKSPSQSVRDICDQFEMRSFCPEMGVGMGVPRPPIHLVGSAESVRVLDVATHHRDYTVIIQDFARQVLQDAPELCGYILVKGSPSCGYRAVKRFSQDGSLLATGQKGIFAAALAKLDPMLQLEDDESLSDPRQRESCTYRVRSYYEYKKARN